MAKSQQTLTPAFETRVKTTPREKQVTSLLTSPVRPESGQVKGSNTTTSGLNKANPVRHLRAPSLPEGLVLTK